jgi:hypothetical protein
VWDLAPVTVANGVVFAASMAKTGNQLYALDAATGAILWQYAAGSSVNAAPAVVDGSVYWGSGYARAAEGSGNNKLYAFSIGGSADLGIPKTAIALGPRAPSGVRVTVSGTDNAGGVGVYQTRCAVDPAVEPTSFADLPDRACTSQTVTGAGTHTVYAASADKDNNVGAVVRRTFKIPSA